MKFVLTVVFTAVILFVLVSADAIEVENHAVDVEGRARERCAEAYKSCDRLKCCKKRACQCNMLGYGCKMRKTTL
uniref:U27-Sparatoxin-Hju1d_1 n=1 Tax=Heteropoda jugulans TaxID=1358901 RepID=A0A4Q8KDG2_9ARAC